MSSFDQIEWRETRGGLLGSTLTLFVGGVPVGHFYSDAADGLNAPALVREMAEAWAATGRPLPRRDGRSILAALGARPDPADPSRMIVGGGADGSRFGA